MIRKALVPIAGRATRLMPVTSVISKAMLPLVWRDNTIRCLLQLILEQIVSAGIEHVGIVVSNGQTDVLKKYFNSVVAGEYGRLPAHIEFITQPVPAGFGDAVLRAASFIGNDPFMLLLSDHLQVEECGEPACTKQVAEAFDSVNAIAMIGVQHVSVNELSKVGVTGGIRINENICRCRKFIEKPDVRAAQRELTTDGLPEGVFLAHCGIYAFKAEIFDCLLQVGKAAQKAGKETELSDAQLLLLNRYPEQYFLCEIAGRAYDIGTPAGYLNAQIAYTYSNEKPPGRIPQPYNQHHQVIV